MTAFRNAATALTLCSALLAAPAIAQEADMALGSAQAPVTVVEYASVTCPHCAHFHKDVFPAFKAKYVDTGKVRFVFREIPTDPANVAMAGSVLARCAGPNGYFKVIDSLMKGQEAMYETRDAGAFLTNAGAAAGMDQAKVKACVTDQAAVDRQNARIEKWTTEHKIEGTPTFVIDGKVHTGIDTLADMDAALAPALAKRKN